MKKTLQILGIIIFFSTIAYALTYPYELAYKGTKDINLIEDSYKYNSLEEIINKSEFKNKVLLIRVGYPFDTETILPGHKYIENTIITLDDGKKHLIYSKDEPHKYQEQVLLEMSKHYKNKDIEFIFLHINHDNDYQQIDNIRKWKSFIKKHQIKGKHFLMTTRLYTEMREMERSAKEKTIFPYNLIIAKNGTIVNDNAPSPIFEKETLYSQLDAMLNGFTPKAGYRYTLRQHDSIMSLPYNNPEKIYFKNLLKETDSILMK